MCNETAPRSLNPLRKKSPSGAIDATSQKEVGPGIRREHSMLPIVRDPFHRSPSFNLGETCMKKSLIALAALAATSAAFAQSSVTLFGALDAMVSRYSQNGAHKTLMSSSGNTSSAFGVRGVEDLGGGMYAGFWLEAAILNDTGLGNGTGGAVVFQRRSYLSLAGPFGQLRLGRDYTPSFWNHTVFDPFGTLGAAAGSNTTQGGGTNGAAGDNPATAARTNNGLSYLWG